MALCRCSIWCCLVGNGMKFYKDVEEEYYQMYVAKQQGHITEDKLKYFSEEKEKIRGNHGVDPGKIGTFGTGDCTKTE